MKKNILSFALLAISFIAFLIYTQYHKANDDTTPPRITCEAQSIEVSVKASEEDILKGITAFDDRDGNVSDTLVIQGISNFISENERVITFAAIDNSLNVGTIERILVYTDYAPPQFELKRPLSFVLNSKVDFLNRITAVSSLDGNITKNIRYNVPEAVDNLIPGSYPIEYYVTDSAGRTTYFETEIEIYDSVYSTITVNLSDYLVYLPKGSDFDPVTYYRGSNIEGNRSISGEVDTNTPGTYHVDYFVNAENASGKARLTVVVY